MEKNFNQYISLTSIYQNQEILLKTLYSLIKQTIIPTKIYLFLSESPYLLDCGFQNKEITYNELREFVILHSNMIEVRWVENTGPYRKLLPLLEEKWDENCIIITVDDDTVYTEYLLEEMIKDYMEKQCVVGYRGFTPMCKVLDHFNYNKRKDLDNISLYNFVTGKGGILYCPQFFYKTKDLVFNHSIYMKYCPTADDIWFYLIRIINGIKCYIKELQYMTKDNTNELYALYFNYNKTMNTNILLTTLEELKKYSSM
jgi:hypothetical protein